MSRVNNEATRIINGKLKTKAQKIYYSSVFLNKKIFTQRYKETTQQTFTYSNSKPTIETLEKGVNET